MAKMKKMSGAGGDVGKSQYFPTDPSFKGTFWSGGWGQTEEASKPGSQEKSSGMSSMKTGSKHGACPFCK